MGDMVRNLTTWEDVDASRMVFAVGNAAFAAFFLGKSAVFLLWLAFVAAFLVPVRHELVAWASGVTEGEGVAEGCGLPPSCPRPGTWLEFQYVEGIIVVDLPDGRLDLMNSEFC